MVPPNIDDWQSQACEAVLFTFSNAFASMITQHWLNGGVERVVGGRIGDKGEGGSQDRNRVCHCDTKCSDKASRWYIDSRYTGDVLRRTGKLYLSNTTELRFTDAENT